MLVASLTACGGGGGGGGNSSIGGGSAAVSYKFVPPVQGQWQTYAATVTDVGNNSGTYSYTDTITQVNADGSYSLSSEPSGGVAKYTLDGNNYIIDPYTDEYDSKGQIIQSHDTTMSASDICIAAYPSGGMPSTVTQGQSWDDTHSWTCQGHADGNSGGIVTLLGAESVTVTAGTFSAYKFQEVVVMPDASGPGVTTTTTTTWRNASATDSRALKISALTAVTGRTPPASQIQASNWELISYK